MESASTGTENLARIFEDDFAFLTTYWLSSGIKLIKTPKEARRELLDMYNQRFGGLSRPSLPEPILLLIIDMLVKGFLAPYLKFENQFYVGSASSFPVMVISRPGVVTSSVAGWNPGAIQVRAVTARNGIQMLQGHDSDTLFTIAKGSGDASCGQIYGEKIRGVALDMLKSRGRTVWTDYMNEIVRYRLVDDWAAAVGDHKNVGLWKRVLKLAMETLCEDGIEFLCHLLFHQHSDSDICSHEDLVRNVGRMGIHQFNSRVQDDMGGVIQVSMNEERIRLETKLRAYLNTFPSSTTSAATANDQFQPTPKLLKTLSALSEEKQMGMMNLGERVDIILRAARQSTVSGKRRGSTQSITGLQIDHIGKLAASISQQAVTQQAAPTKRQRSQSVSVGQPKPPASSSSSTISGTANTQNSTSASGSASANGDNNNSSTNSVAPSQPHMQPYMWPPMYPPYFPYGVPPPPPNMQPAAPPSGQVPPAQPHSQT